LRSLRYSWPHRRGGSQLVGLADSAAAPQAAAPQDQAQDPQALLPTGPHAPHPRG
jgi:hypothetical protein